MTDQPNAAPGGEENLAPSENDVWGEERSARRGPDRDERGRFARKADEPAEGEGGEPAAPGQAQSVAADPAPQAPTQPAAQPAAPAAAQPAPAAQQQPDIDAIVAAALAKAGVKPGSAQPQQQAPAEDPEPDIAADPAGWKTWFVRQQEVRDYQRRAIWSEQRAKKEFADYAEVEKLVLDAADADPTGKLWQRIFAAAEPAYEMYELGKSLRAQQQIQEIGGDPDGWAEKRILDRMRSDEAFRQKVLAEFQPQPAATAKPHLPPSLATARSTAGRSEPAPTAPTEAEVWGSGRLSRSARH